MVQCTLSEKALKLKDFGAQGGCIIVAKVSRRKRTIDIFGIGRVSIVQGKSVHGSGQECPWFRERVSMVQGKKDRILIILYPACTGILINLILPVHSPDNQIRLESCMIQNLTYGSARGAQQ